MAFLLLALCWRCGTNADPEITAFETVSSDEPLLSSEKLASSYLSSKEIANEKGELKKEEINYSVHAVSAIDFLKRKKKKIAPEDLHELMNESVILLDFELTEKHKNILDAKRNKLDRDKTLQYLVGDILADITIEQNNKTLVPNGHQYENSFGTTNRIRLYFYCSDIDLSKEFRITYHDHLFGAGLVNFTLNNHLDI